MSDWIGATIGGLLNMGTSALSSGLSYASQKKLDEKAYRRQVALLQMQQNFAERMANTAHQREVADLRKAGLNPILSATGGNGAPSPVVSASGVSSGSSVDFDFGSPGDAFANVESASSAYLNKALAEKAKADVEVAKATADKVKSEAKAERVKSKGWSYLGELGDLWSDPNTQRGLRDFFGGSSSARSSSARDSPARSPRQSFNGFAGSNSGYRFYDFVTRRYSNDRPPGNHNFITRKPDGTVLLNINGRRSK